MGGHRHSSLSNKVDYATFDGFDLSDPDLTCHPPADFPFGIETRGAPILIQRNDQGQDEFLVCFTLSDNAVDQRCRHYNQTAQSWEEDDIAVDSTPRRFTTIYLANGSYLLTSGQTSWIYDKQGGLRPGYKFDYSLTLGCAVQLSTDEFFFMQGPPVIINIRTKTKAEFYDWGVPSGVSQNFVHTHCGVVRDNFGKARHLVIAGGQHVGDYTQILDLETMTWSDGPRLPSYLSAGAVVPHKRSFIIMGGWKGNFGEDGYSNQLWEFNPDQFEWIIRPETLTNKVALSLAVLVDDDMMVCD